MEKNDLLDVKITDMTADGEGVGKADAFPLFIKDACVGDIVRCKVMKLKKTYGYARLMEVLSPSPDRVEPLCPKARACGGCQLQMMSFEAENRYKTKKVRENLRRIGGFTDLPVEECIGMPEPWHYRNKAQVPFGYDKNGKLVAGFYAGHSHDIIDMEDCALTFPEAGDVIRTVKNWMLRHGIRAYEEETGKGLIRHVLIRKGFSTGEILVCLIANGRKIPAAEALTAELLRIPGFHTLSVNVNTARNNVILGTETYALYGPGYIEDTIRDIRFRISPESFYQVNPAQTEVLYGKALEFAELTGKENVWDLYCGIGTISLFLAEKAKKVYGVEIVPRAIDDARENARLNGFTNAEFYVGAAEEVLPAWHAANPDERIDVISVDPPRKGLDPRCIETILDMQPERIVYVSCDSATLARDLKILADGGYSVDKVQPVNQFGRTVHVETVVLLSKLHEAKHHVSVKLDMDEMDITAAESKATYEEIKKYVAEHNDGMKVSNLYIAQVKRKCGLELAENLRVATRRMDCSQDNSTTAASDLELVPSHNLPKPEDSKQPQCPKEKEKAIMEALKAFQMI